MRKILLFIFYVSLTSCGIQKTKISEQQRFETITNSLNYRVILPQNWNSYPGCNYIIYTSKNIKNYYNENWIEIFSRVKNEDENITLREFVENDIKKNKTFITLESKNIKKESTKYGETYFLVYEREWNNIRFISTTSYFYFNNTFFIFKYESANEYYEKYLSDADYIFNHLEFK